MYSKKTKGFLAFANIFLALDVICCIVPLVLLVISSFTDNTTLIRNGYQFIPEKFSLDAYAYLLKSGKLIMKAYGMSFVVNWSWRSSQPDRYNNACLCNFQTWYSRQKNSYIFCILHYVIQ